MLNFTLDARDGAQKGSACGVCCCENAKASPGEVNKWSLDYANWSIPIGGRGLTAQTQVRVEKTNSDSGALQFPNASILLGNTLSSDTLTMQLSDGINNPDNVALTYSVMDFYPPKHGKVEIDASGTATYTPYTHAPAYDRFFYEAKTADGITVVVEAIISISTASQTNPPASANMATPIVMINRGSIRVSTSLQTVEFPVQVSPQATLGDVYRITVRQQAIDCDKECFWHESCYDLMIERC